MKPKTKKTLLTMLPNGKTFLVGALLLMSSAGFAQNQIIKLQQRKATVKALITAIEKQTNKSVDYGQNVLNLKKVVHLSATQIKLSDLLRELFKDSNVDYTITEQHILISPKTKAHIGTSTPTHATIKIKGQVVDAKGEPLPGVTVRVKGSKNATVTDIDGNYALTANKQSIIEFSYVGFATKEFTAANISSQTVLAESSRELNEVVVTALGIKREQKALSYNVQQVKGEELTRNKDANFINSLNGKVAGVNINASSSGIGGASKVVMRGMRSISQSSNVLYVIDGIPMLNSGGEGGKEFDSRGTSEGIADINPEDVESMSVLTGAAAAALYGEKASNGAIVITTKKGKEGKTVFTVSQTTEFASAFAMPKFQNRYGTGSGLRESGANSYSWGKLLNEANYKGYNPITDYLKTGVVTTEAVTLSTGTKNNQTFISASAVNAGGIVPNNKYNRYNFTVRNTTSLLNDKLKFDLGGSYIIQNDCNMINQGVYNNPLVSAYLYPRGNAYENMAMFERYDSNRAIYVQNWNGLISEFVGQNPYWINYRTPRTTNKYRYMMNAGVNYQVAPWLNLSARVRIDNSSYLFEERFYATTNQTLTGSKNGLYGHTTNTNRQTYADVMATIDKRFFADRLSVNANIGASLQDQRERQLGIRGSIAENLIPNVFTITQMDRNRMIPTPTGYHDQTQSLFASMELGWASQYYLTLTGRNDWPSMLAGPHSNVKSFFYPSIGASWIVSETLKLPKQINYLKVRASFASVGLSFPRWYANPLYEWNESSKQWSNQMAYPVYDLKPERTNSIEFGLQTKLFKHFNLNVTYYSTSTFNQTFDPKISASSGYSKIYVQTGDVSNRGVELALGYNNQWGDFAWESNYTFSANENKINELVSDYRVPGTNSVISLDKLDQHGLGSAHFILKKGGTLGDLYSVADLQRDDRGKIYVDSQGKVYKKSNVKELKLGSVLPKSNMAWRNDFSWRGIHLGFMISARFGGIAYSATQAALDAYGVSEITAQMRDKGYVAINNGQNFINPETWYTTIGTADGIPQYYTYSATNIRLQEASIGYTFKRNRLFGIGDLHISVVGRNLWMLYCKAPFDPEATATVGNYYQGIDKFMTPTTRNVGFNIKLTF